MEQLHPSRHDISDDNGVEVSPPMAGRAGQLGGVAADTRRFPNAILAVAETGIPWRDPPARYGKWDTAYHRYDEWCGKGRWQRVFEAVRDPDPEWPMLDGTVVRAHRHAAGMNTGGAGEGPGRSRGGFGTKTHGGFDALGNPVTFRPGPGPDADVTHARAVVGGLEPEVVIADEGYDSGPLVAAPAARGAEVVIPPRANRTCPRADDPVLYEERNKAERGFGLLEQYRRVATRDEERPRNFLGMVLVAAIMVLLR